jgi:hypothetical protein
MMGVKDSLILPAVPNSGHRFGCMYYSCQLLLEYLGAPIPVHRFIPLTAAPFGFLYHNDGKFVMAMPYGCPCQEGMKFISTHLGYQPLVLDQAEWETAWNRARETLASGVPLVAGPFPMRLFNFNPRVEGEPLWDHFCLVTGYQDNHVVMNEMFGFSGIPIPLEEFKKTWVARGVLCPRDILPNTPFFFGVQPGKKDTGLTEKEMLPHVFRRGMSLLEGKQFSSNTCSGIQAQERLIIDLRRGFGFNSVRKLVAILRQLSLVTFTIGHQAKYDLAVLLKSFDPGDIPVWQQLVDIYMQESRLYFEAINICMRAIDEANSGGKVNNYLDTIALQLEQILELEKNAHGCLALLVS